MRLAIRSALLTAALLAACRPSPPARPAPAEESDSAAVRRVFEANVDAIHKRDRARYLSYYLQNETLVRNGPGGPDLGFAGWSARRDSTWPDTLVARDLRLFPVAPGVMYGSYHYRVSQSGITSEGISERVFVNTPVGWKIGVSTAFGLPAGASPPPVALVGATLVNPGAAAIRNAVVIVRDGRIVCAGAPSAECSPPPGMEVVNAAGTWVIPGLIDAHVHYSQTGWVDGRPDALDLRDRFPYDSVIPALQRHPENFDRAYLCTGVTGVFDVGGYPWTLAMARGHEGMLDAPRVVAAGPLLSTVDHWLNLPQMRQFLYMKDDSTVRASVRALARAGSSAIKVWYIQLPDSARTRARTLLLAAGEEAKKAGLPLIVHATQLQAAKDALRAGATVLVHSVDDADVDEEFIELAKSGGATVIPTLTVREGYADVYLGRSPGARYPLACVDSITRSHLESVLPDGQRARGGAAARSAAWDRQRTTMDRNLLRMRSAGIAIATGTDAGNPGTAHGPSIYREMEAMQHAGLPPADVLASTTIVAARAMRRERDLGSLIAGKRADLVVLDGDPQSDIANTRLVRMVMRGGALYGRAELLPRR
ncbi:MAG: amidohydrolase family protein [Gemmatimonadota bacterium]|nr:amidohydrolase family protein [Gemmatimonadota bacterium]